MNKKYYCPKRKEELIEMEAEGLWCNNRCYKSEYELWLMIQEAEKNGTLNNL